MARAESGQVYFREVQRFTQWWLWVIVLGVAYLQWHAFIVQIVLKGRFGDNPAPDWLVIVFFVLFGLGLPLLFIVAQLLTEVCADALYVRFVPFHPRWLRIAPESIRTATAGTYNPLVDYGGWGIKQGRGGKVYNVSGNQGVQLEFSDGRKLMLGSQHAVELAAAIDELLKRQGGSANA
jgi:hypothetical protein